MEAKFIPMHDSCIPNSVNRASQPLAKKRNPIQYKPIYVFAVSLCGKKVSFNKLDGKDHPQKNLKEMAIQ